MRASVSISLHETPITIETGHLAKQANGSVLVSQGNNRVLVTAVASRQPKNVDFLPLTVEYQERFYSVGRIPGGYFKREGRPSEQATLNARLIDRPIRPLFPDSYRNETQVVVTVLSVDSEFPIEILASLGASAALHLSDIPFEGPIAAVRVGLVGDQFVLNPSKSRLESSTLDLLVAGSSRGVIMLEGSAQFIPEETVLKAIAFAEEQIKPLLEAQEELRRKAGVAKQIPAPSLPSETREQKDLVEAFVKERIGSIFGTGSKADLDGKITALESEARLHFSKSSEFGSNSQFLCELVPGVVDEMKAGAIREVALKDGRRIDGRTPQQVRAISCEVGTLPRTHGSGIFNRGETQVLGVSTLGMIDDAQFIEDLRGETKKNFMLHYNFPPYSVGETGRLGGQSRREIGHGNLAERSILPTLPSYEQFPYVIRVVSEVLSCNGSSSMGSVCAATLALLDAGVPIKENIAAIAMGLFKDKESYRILSDIIAEEDFCGDMDFKVAGSRRGLTAIQMDIKVDGLPMELMKEILLQSREARLGVLSEMEKTISKPRGSLSENAPRIDRIKIPVDRIRDLIGPGGKVIKEISATSGAQINVEDDGTVTIGSYSSEAADKAKSMIKGICEDPEVGSVYEGTVVKIMEFGAFVQILPGSQGLLHISEISAERIQRVEDVLAEGDRVRVKVLEVDRAGRVRLSRRAIAESAAEEVN